MADRFPGYDVLAKRDSASWNTATRRAVDERLALAVPADAFTPAQLATLRRLVGRICPDPEGRPATTTLAMVARKIAADGCDGFRHAHLPRTRECWLRGLDAIEAEAREQYAISFAALADPAADPLRRAIVRGTVRAAAWADLPPRLFWVYRLVPD
ncbi:MAG: gluconate 2-dehydrogenase subunit 3 family protein, partial [Tsuneonella sp.]